MDIAQHIGTILEKHWAGLGSMVHAAQWAGNRGKTFCIGRWGWEWENKYQEGAQCGHTVFGQNSGHTVCSNYPTVCAQHRPIKPSPRNSRLTLLLRLPTGALTRVKINNIDNRGSADILSFLPSLLPIFRCFFCFLRMNAKDLAAAAVELNS